jgi:hypothetical protein
MGGAAGSDMPLGQMDGGAATGAGTMPTGAMQDGGMDAAGGAMGTSPGADGMPAGTMHDQQNGAKPGETTPNRATLEGAAGGLTIRGEWRLTLSSIATGSGG